MKETILQNIDFTIKNLQENVFRVKRNENNDIVYSFNEGPIPRQLNTCTSVVYGKTIRELVGEDNAQEVLPYFEEAFTGKVTSYQLHIGDFIFQTILSPVEIEGVVVEVSGTSFDITEKVKKEEELIAAYDKLKEINESKNKLFSIIAHDLRGPLGNMMNLLEFATDALNEKAYDKTFRLLHGCKKAAENSYHLLEELFDWVRDQIDEIEFEPNVYNINDEILKCIEHYLFIAENKNLTIQFDNEEQFEVCADKNTINAVIRNLISNAIKFSFEHSIITIGLKAVGEDCIIGVEDSGVGIAEDRLERVFDCKEDDSTTGTKGEKGTGLGLGLCAQFVHKNKGEINVKSVINKGSRFYFSIPRHCSTSADGL